MKNHVSNEQVDAFARRAIAALPANLAERKADLITLLALLPSDYAGRQEIAEMGHALEAHDQAQARFRFDGERDGAPMIPAQPIIPRIIPMLRHPALFWALAAAALFSTAVNLTQLFIHERARTDTAHEISQLTRQLFATQTTNQALRRQLEANPKPE